MDDVDLTPTPQFSATMRDELTAEFTDDGVSEFIQSTGDEDVREEILNRVSSRSRALGRPVQLEMNESQGTWPLLVHPDGRVESYGAFRPSATAPPRGHGPARREEPALDGDGKDGHGVPGAADARESPGIDEPEAQVHEAEEHAAEAEIQEPEAEIQEPEAEIQEPEQKTREPEPETPQPTTENQESAESQDDETPAWTDQQTPAEVPSAVPAVATWMETAGTPPTLDDFLGSRPPAPAGPAQQGWRRVIRSITGGLIAPAPGPREQAHRNAIAAVQRSLSGPRTVVVVNPKGGAHKTTATLLIAATFGIYRGGYTLAWDNNETRGTLGWRANRAGHSNTAVDLLGDLGKFSSMGSARVGDLDNYVRAQGSAQFDVLASDEDAAASSTIDAAAFTNLHYTLSRFYRVIVVDTGNNMRASNWEAAIDAADQLVIVSTIREDTAASAAWLVDGLREKGHEDKISQAVTILSSPSAHYDAELSRRLHGHFEQLTRVVVDVPHDPSLVSGGPLNVDALSPQTREAWLRATAAIAEGL